MNKKLLFILISFPLAELRAGERTNPQYGPHRSSSRKRSQGREVTSQPVRSTSIETDLHNFGLNASSRKNKHKVKEPKGKEVHTVPDKTTFDENDSTGFSLSAPVKQRLSEFVFFNIPRNDSTAIFWTKTRNRNCEEKIEQERTIPVVLLPQESVEPSKQNESPFDAAISATVAQVLTSPRTAFCTIVDDVLEHTPETKVRTLVDPFEQALREEKEKESWQTGSSSVPLSPVATAEQPRRRSSSLSAAKTRAQAFERVMRGLPAEKKN